jgi:hypothetical protein
MGTSYAASIASVTLILKAPGNLLRSASKASM